MAQIYIIFIYNTFIFYIFSSYVIFVDVIVFFRHLYNTNKIQFY